VCVIWPAGKEAHFFSAVFPSSALMTASVFLRCLSSHLPSLQPRLEPLDGGVEVADLPAALAPTASLASMASTASSSPLPQPSAISSTLPIQCGIASPSRKHARDCDPAPAPSTPALPRARALPQPPVRNLKEVGHARRSSRGEKISEGWLAGRGGFLHISYLRAGCAVC